MQIDLFFIIKVNNLAVGGFTKIESIETLDNLILWLLDKTL
jgi:hypothetical protein